jgi:hypothetical protein
MKGSPFKLRSPLKQDLNKKAVMEGAAEASSERISRREPMLPPGVGHDESVRRGGELRKKNQEQFYFPEKSSRPSTRLELAVAKRNEIFRNSMKKKSGKLKKKKTDIIQPVAKIKPSSIVKNPKI